ncbi:DNA cytosine methyltransferase [Cerasicoccus fimbriatus]|uniref:DNA cytosine methyltransferase n=1 Tax=Cerasicoccus fimbriatus TaxID=3014554 RepID=UPI0022B34DD5|nr:DNA cytosine methyltransferase [Cerasicoccus sp. TK19100]
MSALTFYEFFAGGGMARMGLGPGWTPVFANDCDAKKNAAYRQNWGADEPLDSRLVQNVATRDLPGCADLAWASFPCQDLSLAGGGTGLAGERSGSFWAFWDLMSSLQKQARAPRCIVLENVGGLLTSHQGEDFRALADALGQGGYRFGALLMDAVDFLPQSRPRLFIVALHRNVAILEGLSSELPAQFHPVALQQAYARLSAKAQRNWVWWKLPKPPERSIDLADVIEAQPTGVDWHTPDETLSLLSMMHERHRDKLAAVQANRKATVGTIYRRTRIDNNGNRVQRAEVRFDGVAGCLRTPGGGSSRQTLIFVDGESVRTRLVSVREAARLMGLPDSYQLPARYNEGYHLIGDGVAVPVVRYLAAHLLEPLLGKITRPEAATIPA